MYTKISLLDEINAAGLVDQCHNRDGARVEKGLLLLFEAIPINTTDIYLGTLPNLALSKNIQTL